MKQYIPLRALRAHAFGILVCCSLLLPAPVPAYEDVPLEAVINRDADAVLGVSTEFGRWNGPMFLSYDPDNAPTLFASDAHFVELLEQAIYRWERVSGVQIEFAGVNRNAPDDTALPPERKDFTVRIHWSDISGTILGRGGAATGYYDQTLGYAAFIDGTLELNRAAGAIASDAVMIQVLTHELGHLLGLGHSDNPASVMYANPYNDVKYPREDDIRAMRVLYGQPKTTFDAAQPLAEWSYTVPAPASASVTQYLFKANQATTLGPYFTLSNNGDPIASVSASSPDESFVWLYTGGMGNWSNTSLIYLDTQIVIIDPFGYEYDRIDWNLQCAPTLACGGAGRATYRTRNLKTLPGTWKFHVVNKANNTLLLSMNLPVISTPARNHAPVATVMAQQDGAADRVRITIAATDQENNSIMVRWHPPEPYTVAFGQGIFEALGSDGVASQSIDFNATGVQTFFVELTDTAPRYNSSATGYGTAGTGFQTLLRITVKLPLVGAADDLEVVATHAEDPELGGSGGTVTLNTTELSTISVANTMTGVIASDGSATTARFTLGASRDRGVTTRTSFSSRDNIVIAGTVTLQAADLVRAGSIFFVIRSGDSWSYRDGSGAFKPWDTRIPSLQPAYYNSNRISGSLVELFNGKLPAGDHRVYIGYRLDNSNALYYTSSALRLTVTD